MQRTSRDWRTLLLIMLLGMIPGCDTDYIAFAFTDPTYVAPGDGLVPLLCWYYGDFRGRTLEPRYGRAAPLQAIMTIQPGTTPGSYSARVTVDGFHAVEADFNAIQDREYGEHVPFVQVRCSSAYSVEIRDGIEYRNPRNYANSIELWANIDNAARTWAYIVQYYDPVRAAWRRWTPGPSLISRPIPPVTTMR